MEGERARKAPGLWNTLNVLGDQFLPGHSVTWGQQLDLSELRFPRAK